MSHVALKRISKSFGAGLSAVASVDLSVPSGEMLAVLGPSGSGKSTLLRLIAGLDAPSSGQVEIDGRDMTGRPPSSRDVAMVFQNQVPYPHLDVFENLAFGLRARRESRPRIADRVAEVADILGLTGKLDRRPATLSGGEKQRVSLGRALARRPKVLLLDEPFSNLDAPLRSSLRDALAAAHRKFGTTTLLVTHDQAEAMALGNRVAVMDCGRIAQVGPPSEVYDRPANRFVAGFVGDPPMNVFPAEAVIREGRAYLILLPDGPEWFFDGLPCAKVQGVPILAGIRPERVRVGGPDPGDFLPASGVVERVEQQGFDILLKLSIAGREIVARLPGRGKFREGETLPVAFDPAAFSWFRRDGERIDGSAAAFRSP